MTQEKLLAIAAAHFNLTSVPTVHMLNESRIIARHTGLIKAGSVTFAIAEDGLLARISMPPEKRLRSAMARLAGTAKKLAGWADTASVHED